MTEDRLAEIERRLASPDWAFDDELADIAWLVAEVKRLRERRYCDVWPTCSTCSEHNREYGYAR